MATLPYWNNDEVISSDKLNSMVKAIIDGDPLAIKVSNATKNDVNQIVSYLSSLYNSAKTNLNSATSTSAFDTAYTDMKSLVSNKLGSYANDDTVDLYSTGIRASIITFLQAYDTMMSNDRLNNKNTDNTLNGRIDSEAQTRANDDNAINTKINSIQASGGGRNLLRYSTNDNGKFQPNLSRIDNYIIYAASTAYMRQGQQYTVHANASEGLVWSDTHNPNVESNNVVLWLTDQKDVSQIISDANTGTKTTFTWDNPSGTYYLRVNTYKTDNSGYVEKVMLEKGTVAHDWQPAPDDTDSDIKSVNAKADANTASISKITSNGGGRNLLVGTSTASGDVASGDGSVIKGAFNGFDAVKLNTAFSGRKINLKSALGRANAKAGDWFTISVYVKADKQIGTGVLGVYRALGSVDAATNDGALPGISMQDKPITTQWQQYSWSFQINDISLQRQDTRVEYTQDTGDNWIYWAGWMLEKGIVAHDWQPAPEDTQSQIDNINANKISSSDVNWNLVANNSKNAYNYASGSIITFPNNSSITLKDDRIIPHINLPVYLTDNLWNTDLNNLATSGNYDSAFIPSATMATLANRPTNPDTNAPLTGDCFYTSHYAYSGTTVHAFQKIYSCDYNYTFTRSYNGSSGSWTNWSCLTPYA